MRQIFKDILYLILRFFAKKNTAIVLCYHSISEQGLFFCVTPQEFEKQMAYLAQNHFNIVSLDTLARYKKEGAIPEKTVAITFDDGYEDNYVNASPLLKRYGFPATVFVAVGNIGRERSDLGNSLKMLSWEQCRELEGNEISIEPHTVHHVKLSGISPEIAEQEVRESKKSIENTLGKICRHFAYPKGRYTAETMQSVRRAGIPYAYTIEGRQIKLDDNDLALSRCAIDSAVTFFQFKRIIRIGKVDKKRLVSSHT